MIRVYGHTFGQGSFTQVTRGFVEAATARGLFAGFVPIDAEFEEHPPGGTAKVAVNCGAPSAVYLPTRIGDHKQRWLMLAPNSDQLPEAMVRWLPEYATGFLSPSEWGAGILRRFFSLPVKSCPHGVSEHFRPTWQERRVVSGYDVLHLTSTNAERKGTRELLEAWKGFVQKVPGARLLVVAPREGLAEQRFWVSSRGISSSVKVIGSGELGAGLGLAKAMSLFDLVCQPSRAEGFGLVPLEARCVGVPVAATGCTGHSEHFPQSRIAAIAEGCVLIETGDDVPVDDFPHAMAPSLSAEAVLAALEEAYANRAELAARARQKAPELAAAWTWDQRTGPVLQELVDG